MLPLVMILCSCVEAKSMTMTFPADSTTPRRHLQANPGEIIGGLFKWTQETVAAGVVTAAEIADGAGKAAARAGKAAADLGEAAKPVIAAVAPIAETLGFGVFNGVCSLAQQAGCDIGAQVAVSQFQELGNNAGVGADLCVMLVQQGCTIANEVLPGIVDLGTSVLTATRATTTMPTTTTRIPTEEKVERKMSKELQLILIVGGVMLVLACMVWCFVSNSRR